MNEQAADFAEPSQEPQRMQLLNYNIFNQIYILFNAAFYA